MPTGSESPQRQLTLFDSTCLILGIIVGAGVYQVAPTVAAGTSTPAMFLLIWVIGGVLSLFGALGYAELATALPEEGGDYVYLGRAYGRWAGFLFGWTQLVVVRPGDIAGMAFIFATYGRALYDPFQGWTVAYDRLPWSVFTEASVPLGQLVYAVGAVAVLTAVHAIGVREGKWTQNILTVTKVVGLLLVVGVALFAEGQPADSLAAREAPWSLALILVLFTFGGWNEMAYVAAEVKNPNRNIVRALVLGTASVTLLYLLINGAYLWGLGTAGIAASNAVATDLVSGVLPNAGARAISVLVCISALGATSGLIFTGARISYALGADHAVFRPLGRWNVRTGTPLVALVAQGLIAAGLVVALGNFVNAILYTAAAVYSFYFFTSVAVFVLRWKEPARPRPYRVTGYPVTTLVFCAVCAFLIYSAVVYKPAIAAATAVILMAGLPIYWISRRVSR